MQYVKKDKLTELLAEKLCGRLAASESTHQARAVSYCLGQLKVSWLVAVTPCAWGGGPSGLSVRSNLISSVRTRGAVAREQERAMFLVSLGLEGGGLNSHHGKVSNQCDKLLEDVAFIPSRVDAKSMTRSMSTLT